MVAFFITFYGSFWQPRFSGLLALNTAWKIPGSAFGASHQSDLTQSCDRGETFKADGKISMFQA